MRDAAVEISFVGKIGDDDAPVSCAQYGRTLIVVTAKGFILVHDMDGEDGNLTALQAGKINYVGMQ